MTDFTILRIDDMEAIGAGSFKRARASLGVTSFGMQVIDLPRNSTRYPGHDHRRDGQEEVYVVLHGRGEIEIDGVRHPLGPDTMVRIGAEVTRKLWPGSDGMRVLVIGGVPGQPYRAPGVTKLGAADPGAGISATMTRGSDASEVPGESSSRPSDRSGSS